MKTDRIGTIFVYVCVSETARHTERKKEKETFSINKREITIEIEKGREKKDIFLYLRSNAFMNSKLQNTLQDV